MTPEEEIKQWPYIIGGFLINFGAIEHIAIQWVRVFSTDQIIRDIAIDLPLHKRLKLVCELIERSNLSEVQKKEKIAIWKEVEEISRKRNIIAHNPFITHQNQSGFVDLKKFKGHKDGEKMPMVPLTFADIARAGSRLSKILEEVIKEI